MIRFTRVPNFIFDDHLNSLSGPELKLILVVIRQTYGWITANGKRKERDRITIGQFKAKTGLSKRAISLSIRGLIYRKLILVTDTKGNPLIHPKERKGKFYLFYSVTKPEHFPTQDVHRK